MFTITRFNLAVLSLVVALTTGCAAQMDAVQQMVRLAWSRDTGADRAPLNPRFRYLRVTNAEGQVALLVLGYVDPHPEGAIEVFYSAEKEALRLQNGRIVGAAGMTTEWRNVALKGTPQWPQMIATTTPVEWVRVRDVMPGYRYGVRDVLELRPVPAPSSTKLRGLDPNELRWFEEVQKPVLRTQSLATERLPVARYGIAVDAGNATVVYGEQCLSQAICFFWQRWPAAPLGK